MLGSIFGQAAAPNMSATNGYMSTLGNIATGLGSQAGATGSTLTADDTQNQNALNAYSAYLKANPATQQQNAEMTANAEQGASEGAAHADANLDQQLASRGIAPNSSAGVGGLASVQEGLAANDANVQAQVGENNEAQYRQNLGTLANLWSGQQQNAFGQNMATTNAQAGIDTNLANMSNQQALQAYNIQLAQQQANNQLLGTLGTDAAKAYAAGAAG